MFYLKKQYGTEEQSDKQYSQIRDKKHLLHSGDKLVFLSLNQT